MEEGQEDGEDGVSVRGKGSVFTQRSNEGRTWQAET